MSRCPYRSEVVRIDSWPRTSCNVSAAFADSPHYVKGPTAAVQDNSLVISWKAAGLGNTVTSVDFALTGTVTTTSQCFTKSGNPVNGVPKSETIDVNATGSLPVRNVVILSVAFDLTLTGDDLPPVHLTSP
jgi:hypothetical protein